MRQGWHRLAGLDLSLNHVRHRGILHHPLLLWRRPPNSEREVDGEPHSEGTNDVINYFTY